jgi:hypothetical protein
MGYYYKNCGVRTLNNFDVFKINVGKLFAKRGELLGYCSASFYMSFRKVDAKTIFETNLF